MKILGKNVYIGNICICTEFTSQIMGDLKDIQIGEKSHKCKVLDENVLFVKDANGLYVDVRETEKIGGFAIRVFGAATRYKQTPLKAGDYYIDAKHYFNDTQSNELYDLKELLHIAQNLKTNKTEITL